MHMSFWFGVKFDNFLFKGFHINSWQGMLGTCLGTASLSCLFVIISFSREMFFNSDGFKQQGRAILSNSNLIEVWTSSWKMHLLQTFMFLAQTALGYLLMLIVMSYNVYLSVAVISGTLFGYFILNPVLIWNKFVTRPMSVRVVECEEERGALISHSNGSSSEDSKEENQEFSVSAVIHNSDPGEL